MEKHKQWLLFSVLVMMIAVCHTEDITDLKLDQDTQDKVLADILKELGVKSVQPAQAQNDFTEEEKEQINEVEEESYSMANSIEKYATAQFSSAASSSNKRGSKKSKKGAKTRTVFEKVITRYENRLLTESSLSKEARNALQCIHHFGDFTNKKGKKTILKTATCSSSSVTADQCREDHNNKRGFRTIDGSCNNVANPNQGKATTAFRRLIPPFYEDGIYVPRGRQQAQKCLEGFELGPFDPPTPSAREASRNIILNDEVVGETSHSHMIMQWGQFLDHDLDLAPEAEHEEPCKSCEIDEDCEPIQIRDDDTLKGSTQDGKCINFRRSIPVCSSDSETFAPREQVNDITSYLDGSQIYGSDKELAERLRLPNSKGEHKGKLDTSEGRLLPTATGVEDCGPAQIDKCFLAGDVRANEQVGLTALHTIFVREHNRIAEKLVKLNPHHGTDTVYLITRKIVGAMLQKITYEDYLPKILGTEWVEKLLRPYNGYKADVDSSIPNVFATAALRYGHSLIQPKFTTYNRDSYENGDKGSINLRDSFFNFQTFKKNLPDRILRGLVTQPALRNDEFMNEVLTTQLFFDDGVGLDLAALNIQRGRDHGLPVYGVWRSYCKTIYPDLPDAVIASGLTLKKIYQVYGTPEVADIFVAGLAERALPGSILGPTFACIFGITFSDLRDGDRFYYENPGEFSTAQLNEIRKASLSRIICDNARTGGGKKPARTEINKIQPDAFLIPGEGNNRGSCSNLPKMDLDAWEDKDVTRVAMEELARSDDKDNEEEMALFDENHAKYMDPAEENVNGKPSRF